MVVQIDTQLIFKQIILTFAASSSYFVIGLVRGYSSSALPSIKERDPYLLQSVDQLSWAGSIPPLGAFFGSLVSGPLMKYFGRRKVIMLSSPIWTLSWICIANSVNFYMLATGRILSGFCAGLALPAAQIYVSECSSPHIRGRLGSVPALFMSIGILVSYIQGYYLNWSYLAWTSAALSTVIFFAMLALPESPSWLSMNGKYAKAEQSLKWLHLPITHESIKLNNIETKIPVMVNGQIPENDGKTLEDPLVDRTLFTKDVFFSREIMKPLGIGLALLAFQQISGIDAVIFYTVEIFRSSGSTLNNHVATIIVGLVQLISNMVSLLFVDKLGRKVLLMTSGVITAIATGTMGVAFYIDLDAHVFLGYLPLISLIVFMIGFSLGFGCIPFLLMGELFPAQHRGALSALAGSFNLIVMFLVVRTYHVIRIWITSAGTFWMYSGFCTLSVIFVALFVPETKGITLQDIEKHFSSKQKEAKPENYKSDADPE